MNRTALILPTTLSKNSEDPEREGLSYLKTSATFDDLEPGNAGKLPTLHGLVKVRVGDWGLGVVSDGVRPEARLREERD